MASRRRKGERPIDHSQFYRPCDATHPVARAIASGSSWFHAWQFQYGYPDVRLARLISMSPSRMHQLAYGAPVLRAEIDALAGVYGVQPSDIIASLPDPTLLI